MKKLLLLPLIMLAGCMSVPTTKIAFDPITRTITIASPKDVELKDLNFTITGTNATVTVGTYSSKNNAEVVKVIADANIAQLQSALDAAKAAVAAAMATMVP